MDRSFLSNADVVKASRDFVCIRLATYEDKKEAEFLKSFKAGRSDELENTVFVLLAPDGKERLSKATRGANFEFRSPDILANSLSNLALAFEDNKHAEGYVRRLPKMKDFRLGLNVSSCDGLPSVICVGKDEKHVADLEKKLSPIAFSKEVAGKFVYASSQDTADLKVVNGYKDELGFVIVKPGEFGVEGEMVKAFGADTKAEDLKAALVAYANGTAKVQKNHRSHVAAASREGKVWETEIPVTDPDSLRAMARRSGSSRGAGESSRGKSGRGSRRGPPGGGPPRGGQ